MASAIRIEALTKYFGAVVGLEGLSLDVEAGEVFGFLGPNGSGKTTTIRLLLDLLRPTSGHAWICGLHCRTQGVAARRHVGYLPGDLPIYPELTGARFLRYLASVGGTVVEPSRLERLLQRFDVSDIDLSRPMRDYSQGMKRKLGIIQALAPHPPLLILDEPTSGLDPLMIEAFAQTLAELKQEGRTTIFLSSHVLSEVERTCDRVGLIRRGQLALVESLASLRAAMPRRVTITFASPAPRQVPALAGVTLRTAHDTSWVLEVRGALGPLVTALGGLPIEDLRVDAFSLEEYVLGFYGSESAS